MGQGSSTNTNTKQLPSKPDSADDHILSNLCGNQGCVVDEGCTSYKISLRQKRDENSFISEAREQPKLTYTEVSQESKWYGDYINTLQLFIYNIGFCQFPHTWNREWTHCIGTTQSTGSYVQYFEQHWSGAISQQSIAVFSVKNEGG